MPPPLTPRQIMAAVHALGKLGDLRTDGGRPKHVQYCHPAHPVPWDDTPELGRLALAGVETAYGAADRPVTTREVRTALRAAGVDLRRYPSTRRGLNLILDTLAGTRRDAGGAGAASRRIKAWTSVTATGRPCRWWAPSWAVEPATEGSMPAANGTVGHHRPARAGPPSEVAGSGETIPGAPAAPALGATPRDAADAFRRAVVAAAECLGRPAAYREVCWWADAHAASDPAARLVAASRGQMMLTTVRHRDPEYAGRPGRVAEVRNIYTCHGGSPVRFAAYADAGRAPDDDARRRCVLVDTLSILRAGDEWQELAAARGGGREPGRGPAAYFAPTRHGILAGAILAAFGGRSHPAWIPSRFGVESAPQTPADALPSAPRDVADAQVLLTAERAALALLERWTERASLPEHRRTYRRAILRARAVDLDVAAAVLAAAGRARDRSERGATPAGTPDAAPALGPGAVAAPAEEVAPLLRAARAILGLKAAGAYSLLTHARRFPPNFAEYRSAALPTGTRAEPGQDGPGGAAGGSAHRLRRGSAAATAVYDRVDAVLAAFDAAGPPRATALLAGARRLLGHTLRDASRLEAALATAGSATERRALTIALGLLGESIRVLHAVEAWDRADVTDAAAAVLALVVADPGGAVRHLAAADARARGAAQHLTDRALARAGRGHLLSVLD